MSKIDEKFIEENYTLETSKVEVGSPKNVLQFLQEEYNVFTVEEYEAWTKNGHSLTKRYGLYYITFTPLKR